jgi:hypothetical protein
MGLDDRLAATSRAIATQPATYRPGTLSVIANAYDDAGEAAKAADARQLALLEPVLLPFARSSAAAQQRQIDALPEEARPAAQAIQRHQEEAFAKDPFAAGTALYPEVGAPVAVDDIVGRITQARTIAAYRGIPVAPFTADEIANMHRTLADGTAQQREALLTMVNALPGDMKAAVVPVRIVPDTAEERSQPNAELAPINDELDDAPAISLSEPQTRPSAKAKADTSGNDALLASLPIIGRPDNENRTPEELCQRAFDDMKYELNWGYDSTGRLLTPNDKKLWFEEGIKARDFCLKKAQDGLIPRDGLFIDFPGGGRIIFRPNRAPLYRPPSRYSEPLK